MEVSVFFFFFFFENLYTIPVINYAFKELHAIDMKLYQIGIEEVVKKIYLEEENRGKENV